jgi:hypothetical protein
VRRGPRDRAAERVADDRQAAEGAGVAGRRTTADRPLARLAERRVGGGLQIEVVAVPTAPHELLMLTASTGQDAAMFTGQRDDPSRAALYRGESI